MKTWEPESVRTIVGRLERGDDLIEALYEAARKHGVNFGEIHALGAVTDLEVTEWDAGNNSYRPPIRREELSEVLMLYGNLSEKDGKPFWHLHVSAGYLDGGKSSIIAGHLVRAKVFALEFVLTSYQGILLNRSLDEKTGLYLW
jgi:uncharacterized protein